MDFWEKHFGIKRPHQCHQTGECCRGAAQYRPWETSLPKAAAGSTDLRDFFTLFLPYPDLNTARQGAPHAVEASLQIALERQLHNTEDLIFYRCRYLEGTNTCTIYEDRPQLCRDYPDSPHTAIANPCRFKQWANDCITAENNVEKELEQTKALHNMIKQQLKEPSQD